MFPQAQARRNYKFIYAKQCFPAQIAPTVFFHGYRQNMVILKVGERFLCQSRPSLQEKRETLHLPSTQMMVDQDGGSTVLSISTEKNLGFTFPLVCPEKHFMVPSLFTNYPQFLLSLSPPSHPKSSLFSTWGYTRGLQNTSKQIDQTEFDRHEFPLFFWGGGRE